MKLKYFFILCVLTLFLFVGKGFAYFEDKMYCQITKDNIVISLKAGQWYTCKRYIRSIEIFMKQTYRDILTVQQYLDKKQDMWFWLPVKEKKVSLLNTLQATRQNILAHMQSFEKNLFVKSKTYFLDSIVEYKRKLNSTLKSLSKLKDSKSVSYTLLIENQLSTIERIASSQTFDEMNIHIQRYVYLKKQIEWK